MIGVSVHEGIGVYHSQDEAVQIARLVVTGNALWILIVNITKASILTQYLRIFCFPRTRFCCYTLLAALLPAAAYSLFAGIFLCSPTQKLWNPSTPGTCRSAQTYWLSVAGLDIGLDTLVLLLPLPAILSLHLPPRQKLGLVLAFTLGFTVCAVSIARLVTVYITAQHGAFVMSGVWAVIWNAVEANVGIICACLLALKPLAVKWCPGFFDETRLPRHSTHLKPVDTSGARWSQVRWPTSLEVPATPSSGVSGEKDGSGPVARAKRWSSARAWVAPEMRKGPEAALSELENLGVVEREPCVVRNSSCGGRDGEIARDGEQISIWDMLRQPEEAVARDDGGGSG